jgi:hypothetical protein
VTYSARVYDVLIASPSDVAKERQLARDVILEWNAVNARDKRMVLAPVAWETHASPEMGDRPQAIINKQIARDCDLLIAIFWTRLGTPTGNSPSGTVEEIREHIRAGKPALIYFSEEPVRLDSVDEEQYRALKEFRTECQKSGLYESYSTASAFREKLVRQLAQTVLRKLGSEPNTSDPVADSRQAQLPRITDDQRQLLISAADDPHGSIMMLNVMGGPIIRTAAREFTQNGDARLLARWRAALDGLMTGGFLEDRSGKGELFYVTHAGFQAAERLRALE